MTLTVFEQGAVAVELQAAEARGSLSPVQADGLIALGERMGARIVSWQSPSRLRVEQFVGVVRVGDLELEILPKLEGLAEPTRIRRSLLEMLALTHNLDLKPSELVSFQEAGEPFIRALARLYCRRLLDFVRRGLRQEYVYREDLLTSVRGKIDWPARARLVSSGRLEFPCCFDERSEDTPLNRTLKAALLAAGEILEESRLSSVVTELRHAMDGIGDGCPSAEQIERLRTDRTSRQLEPLLVLAKLMLGNRNPDLGRSTHSSRRTYALVWDMNLLFEEYIGRLCRQVLAASGLGVLLQEGSAFLAVEKAKSRSAFLLKPDILVCQRGRPIAVADTKWKRLSSQPLNLGISSSDVYQVLAYAHRYQLAQAVLIFPHHAALGPPGLRREFETKGPDGQRVRVRVVTVDLASPGEIPRQLAEGFASELEIGAA